MITITVCIGSGCHVKGSRTIISILKDYREKHDLEMEIALKACFCQNRCTEGVVVKFDEEIVTGVSKDNVIEILEERLDID
ncbi:MAG: hypothetical protein PWR10_497 [Halanaerobiales bacterium]|nr:hypothetical protein [Halanaerobiales bacterium]